MRDFYFIIGYSVVEIYLIRDALLVLDFFHNISLLSYSLILDDHLFRISRKKAGLCRIRVINSLSAWLDLIAMTRWQSNLEFRVTPQACGGRCYEFILSSSSVTNQLRPAYDPIRVLDSQGWPNLGRDHPLDSKSISKEIDLCPR